MLEAEGRPVVFVHPDAPPGSRDHAKKTAAVFGAIVRTMPDPAPPDPGLAALVPADLTDPPMRVISHPAIKADKRGPLRRAVDRLGADPRRVIELAGVGTTSGGTIALAIYSVPGIGAADLVVAFASVISKRPSARWTTREIAGRIVRWVDMPEFSNAFWATDELVISVGGAPAAMEAVIPRLP